MEKQERKPREIEYQEKWSPAFHSAMYSAFDQKQENVSFRFGWHSEGETPDEIIITEGTTERTYACSRDIAHSIVWAVQHWADMKNWR